MAAALMRFVDGARLGAYELLSTSTRRHGRSVPGSLTRGSGARSPSRSCSAPFRRRSRPAQALHPGSAGRVLTQPSAHLRSCTTSARDDGVDYFVMELVAGESLAHRLIGGALPQGEALQRAYRDRRRLGAAHRLGIVQLPLDASGAVAAISRTRWHTGGADAPHSWSTWRVIGFRSFFKTISTSSSSRRAKDEQGV